MDVFVEVVIIVTEASDWYNIDLFTLGHILCSSMVIMVIGYQEIV
jgi:hypothetical protein